MAEAEKQKGPDIANNRRFITEDTHTDAEWGADPASRGSDGDEKAWTAGQAALKTRA